MLGEIKNADSKNLNLKSDAQKKYYHFFICAIGFESRSIAIFKQLFKNHPPNECVCFLINDKYRNNNTEKNKDYVIQNSVKPIEARYDDYDKVLEIIKERILKIKSAKSLIQIHVDYSSMPRSWYCRLPVEIYDCLDKEDRANFWYSQGKYQKKSEFWPSAGVDDVYVFSGKASLRPVNNRSHVFGLGFDTLRSQAICTVLDPGFFVATYSYPSDYLVMRDVILDTNYDLLNSAAYSIGLPVDDFEFTISKLTETVRELHSKGDVILVPDGPKPQILASSLIPLIFDEAGVFCLHINRHERCYKPVNVHATGKINGFTIYKNGNEKQVKYECSPRDQLL